MQTPLHLSIVVPAYNEEQNLKPLYLEVEQALSGSHKHWELLFVDDGSSDSTLEVIKDLAQTDSRIRFVSLAHNSGQSAAFGAGFQAAKGELIVTMDADLQNDPADIPRMLLEMDKGVDMVIGWRANRQDTRSKKLASKFANAVRNKLSNETVKDTGCSLKIMRASMARKLPMFTGMHRFLPTLMKLEGARVAEVPVNHRARRHGTSKYGVLDRALTTWADLLAVRWMQRRYVRIEIKEQN